MQILVVEDDSSIRDILTYVAETAFPDASVSGVACGSDALGAMQTNGCPDLILLDLGLPDMSGFDVFAALQKRGCEAKVAIITAEDEPAQRNRASRMGANAFVAKPFDSRELRVTLRNLFQTGDSQDASALLLA